MRGFLMVVAVVAVALSVMTAAPAPVAEAEVDLEPVRMDTLESIKAEAVHYYTDPSCTFVNVRLKDGDRERTVRIGLDAVRNRPSWPSSAGGADGGGFDTED